MKTSYVCPHCHKQVKDLKGHIARVHQEKSAAPKPESKAKPAGKTLELAVKPKPKEEKQELAGYHCVDCGHKLSKGQTPCPNCGATLDWSQL